MKHDGLYSKALKAALLSGTALALIGGTAASASAASMVGRGLERRVSDLEAEVRLLKNRVKALEDRKLAIPDKIVVSGNSRVKVTLYGQVNRAIRFGVSKRDAEVHSVDNDTSSSRIGIFAEGRLFPDLKISALTEVEWQENPRSGTDDSNDGNETVQGRYVDLWFTHTTLGTLHMGHGDAATVDVAAQTLSGTDIVFGSTGGGDDALRFYTSNGSAFPPNGLSMGAACGNFDAGRENRVMYVSPSVQGFFVRVSYGEQDAVDAGVFYEGNPFGLKDIDVVAAFGYRHNPGAGASIPGLGLGKTNVFSGSIGVVHKPTGLNINFAAGTQVFQGNPAGNPKNPNFWYVEGGWTGRIWAMGETSIAGNFGTYNHFTQGAHTWTAGIAIVQKIDAAATDLYAGYRYSDAKLTGTRLDAVNILIVGARIKF